MTEKNKNRKTFKVLKIIGIILGIIALFLVGLYFYVTSHP